MMDALICHARDMKIEKILLTVVSENVRAIRFYKKWHVKPYAIDPDSVKTSDGEYLDEILMACSLL